MVFYLPFDWRYMACSSIFAIASITDFIDGYLARKLQQTTKFGAFLDPVADKLIVAAALILLVETHATVFLAIPATIIIGREIMISALREWMAEVGRRTSIAVSYIGKLKTTLQMLAIITLLAGPPDWSSLLMILGYFLLYAAVFLTLWSMVLYLKAAWPDLTDES